MSSTIAIVGAGPAGLIAAETLARSGHRVRIYDRMASPGRKFLLAGRGGLNLTHSEPLAAFLARYPMLPDLLRDAIERYPPDAVRNWCAGLGEPMRTGSSGRLFPASFKAAPLLRGWLIRLGELGVQLHARHRWTGWDAGGEPTFEAPAGPVAVAADAVLLATGGASWPRMGSDGAWTALLRARAVAVAAFAPSNVGVRIAWPEPFRGKYQGVPLKRIALSVGDGGEPQLAGEPGRVVRGEAMITEGGLEGGAVYALAPELRACLASGTATMIADLRPDLDDATLAARLATPRRARSLSNFLRQEAALQPAAIGLVQAQLHAGATAPLIDLIKRHPLTVTGLQPIERAISSAGGIGFAELDANFMLRRIPGVFAAGEMLDWDAPTGGYLLQACLSIGVAAAHGIEAWLKSPGPSPR